jgi:hypothetical protein
MSAPPTSESESSFSPGPGTLLPTPTTKEHNGPGRLDGPRNDTLRARIANLPTPRARDWKSGGKDGLHNEVRLLKTPTAQLAVNGGSQHPDKRKAGGHGPTLADEVEFLMPDGAGAKLLPTPKATDGTKGGPNQRGSKGDLTLPSAAAQISSGATTSRRFAAGSTSPVDPRQAQLMIEVA